MRRTLAALPSTAQPRGPGLCPALEAQRLLRTIDNRAPCAHNPTLIKERFHIQSMNNQDTRNMAVFCDFENVALGVREAKYSEFDIGKVLQR